MLAVPKAFLVWWLLKLEALQFLLVPQFQGHSGNLRSINVQLIANIKGKLYCCAEARLGLGSLDLLNTGMISPVSWHALAYVCLASKYLFYPACFYS